jgi:hypothetical protein
MARKNILNTNALDNKISIQGENPHQTAFSEPKARGLALLNDQPAEQPKKKEKVERKTTLMSAKAHQFFKINGAQQDMKLLEVIDFAVDKLMELDPEQLQAELKAYKESLNK